LNPDKLLAGRFVDELFQQMDEIERRFGEVSGYLNWQGVLNNAVHLRGQQLFLDIADSPALVEQLLGVLTRTMIRLAQAVQARQRRSVFLINEFCVSNCTVCMLSPRAYGKLVLPCDMAIAQSFERFGVHTCNWNVTPYLEQLVKLPNVGYLDMGLASDLSQARECFPDARRAVLYSPQQLVESTSSHLRSDMERVRSELAPCDVVFADLPLRIPDERVREVLRMCRSLE
jgi:hypothetical protein